MSWLKAALGGALLLACSNSNGGRGQCAEGAALEQCTADVYTPAGACWKLVQCGAIDLESKNFDYRACYDDIIGTPTDQQQLIVDCIAASTCDSLKVDGSPDNPNTGNMTCLVIGHAE